MKYLLTAIFLCAGMAINANADVLHSWEGSDIASPDGWIVDPASKGQTVAFSTTTGVTDGGQSLELTNTQGGGYQELIRLENSQFLADMLSHDKLEIDVHVPGLSVGAASIWWGKAFIQFEGVLTTSVDLNFTVHPHWILNNGLPATEGTLSIDYKSDPSWDPAATFARATIVIQGPGHTTAPNSPIYVDNFRLTTAVPEPASLALLAISGLLCGVVRKR